MYASPWLLWMIIACGGEPVTDEEEGAAAPGPSADCIEVRLIEGGATRIVLVDRVTGIPCK